MWTIPLTDLQVRRLVNSNNSTGIVEIFPDGPIGTLVVCKCITGPHAGETYYCGGNASMWLTRTEYERFHPPLVVLQRMPEPEFDLDDMELAEIIMEELK